MAKKSEATKKAKNRMLIFEIISIALTVIPVCFFVGAGFVMGTTTEKIALSLSSIVGLVFALLNVMLKWHVRCGLWIVIFGLTYAFKENANMIMGVAATMAITCAIDEFIVHPLAKKYKQKFTINKEIDKRM